MGTAAKVTAQVEAYATCLPELEAIYPAHWRELAFDLDIPLAPRYDAYAQYDAAGALLLVTLRDGAKLVGYCIGFIALEMHYSILGCTGDIHYVLPEYRKTNCGVKLLREVERALRERGVKRWHMGSKLKNDCGALLRRIGLKAVETYYAKRLS